MSKVLIVGKMFKENKNNGSSGVIRCLKNEFNRLNLDVDFILLNENIGKIKFLLKIFCKIIKSKGTIVQVHTDGFLIPFYIFLLSLLDNRNKYYLVVHGIYKIQSLYDSSSPNKIKYYIYKNIENILYRKFPNIICISEMLRDDIKSHFSRSNNITVINNGVELLSGCVKNNEVSINDKIKFIYVGGFNPLKGINECIEIMNKLVNEYKINSYLNIYGFNKNINLYETIINKINEYKLLERVEINGPIKDRGELYEKYSENNFNLCLSKYDTFNNAVLESMICGCVPIVSNMCGVSYILESNKDSIVINLNDNVVDETCAMIKKYVNNNEEYQKIKNRGISKAYNYTWKKSAMKYYKIGDEKNE